MTSQADTTEPSRGQESATPTTGHSSYVPKVGDVVTLGNGDKREWIVFKTDSNSGTLLSVVAKNDAWNPLRNSKRIKFLRYTDTMPDEPIRPRKAYAIAKAYFSAKPESEYQVGQLVEVTEGHDDGGFFTVGEVVEVANTSSVGSFTCKKKNGKNWSINSKYIKPLAGTYAEQQAKWVEFYGLKDGSKVKVVREYKSKEGGFTLPPIKTDAEYVGIEVVVSSVCLQSIDIEMGDRGNSFPYFVLEPVPN